jgi:hypothetical protein
MASDVYVSEALQYLRVSGPIPSFTAREREHTRPKKQQHVRKSTSCASIIQRFKRVLPTFTLGKRIRA